MTGRATRDSGQSVLETLTASGRLPADLLDPTVADVVVRMPKTLPADACLTTVRTALDNDHVHMLLLTDGGRLVGTVVRSDLPATRDDADELGVPALSYAVLAGRTVASDLPAEEVRKLMVERGERRLAALDDEGSLLGLLCLKRRSTGFCSDADVAARAGGPTGH